MLLLNDGTPTDAQNSTWVPCEGNASLRKNGLVRKLCSAVLQTHHVNNSDGHRISHVMGKQPPARRNGVRMKQTQEATCGNVAISIATRSHY